MPIEVDANSWVTSMRNSLSEELFPGVMADRGLPLDIFRLKHVCIRDATYRTEYEMGPGSSVPTGRRLELITAGLVATEAARLVPQPGARFVATHLADVAALAGMGARPPSCLACHSSGMTGTRHQRVARTAPISTTTSRMMVLQTGSRTTTVDWLQSSG